MLEALVLFLVLPHGVYAGGEPGSKAAGSVGESVRIGLIIQTEGLGAENGARVRKGIERFLESRSLSGEVTCELRVIPATQRWGKQTTSIVDAIYQEGINVIIGGADRRTNHLAEQIISRSKGAAILISLASDPSLTRAGVPWVFRVAPNQAGVLIANLEDFSADAALVAVEALQRAQRNPGGLREYLLSRNFRGKTGLFSFAENGDRVSHPPS